VEGDIAMALVDCRSDVVVQSFVGGSALIGGDRCPFLKILDERQNPIYADNMHPAYASPCEGCATTSSKISLSRFHALPRL
jgi:hypothetical protein